MAAVAQSHDLQKAADGGTGSRRDWREGKAAPARDASTLIDARGVALPRVRRRRRRARRRVHARAHGFAGFVPPFYATAGAFGPRAYARAAFFPYEGGAGAASGSAWAWRGE